MANRRMMSKDVIDTDNFLDMSLSTQALYFHLLLKADDDGFVKNPKRIMRMIGANDDEMKVLISKKYIFPFESGVCVIKHWRIHNLIRKDRYTETSYKKEKSNLKLNNNGEYISEKEIKCNDFSNNELKELESPKKDNWQEKRKSAMQKSSLPYSFTYKIKNAFIGYNCPVCGVEMRNISADNYQYGDSPNPRPTIQHIKPLSKGGEHELGNIAVICHSCNTSIKDKETLKLNQKTVEEVWHSIGNQSAPQDRLGKVRLGEDRIGKDSKNVSKETEQSSYGREDINEVIKYLKEKIELIDGSQQQNRRFAKLLIDKLKKEYPDYNPVEQIKVLIDIALKDDFHAKNATSIKYFYYNAQKIIQSIKNKKSKFTSI